MSNGNQEFLLWVIKNKYDALADADAYLTGALSNPKNNRTVIESRLDADNLERQLLLARYDAVKAGGNFTFPPDAEVQKLREAISELESAIAESAAVDTVIQTAGAVATTVRASNI